MRKAGLIAGLLTFALAAAPAAAKKGDLIVADFGSDEVKRVDPKTGAVTVIKPDEPPMDTVSYLTFEPTGKLVVTDEDFGGVFRVDPRNGDAGEIASGFDVYGIDREASGNFLVSNFSSSFYRVNRKTGAETFVADDAGLSSPRGVDALPNGTAFFADNGDAAVLKLDRSDNVTGVASGPPFDQPSDVVQTPNRKTLFVSDQGVGQIFRIDLRTGEVDPVASGLGNVYSLALAPDGFLYAPDYSASVINRVDPRTGEVTEVASTGLDSVVGIEVEPPKCKGKLATIVGSTKNDKLKGSKFADVIVGLKGNDKIKGGKGKDLICGGKGKDKLKGGKGKDKLDGGPGKDKERQ